VTPSLCHFVTACETECMKRRRANWTDKLAPHELQQLHDWIDSERDYKTSDLYRLFALERKCSKRSFRAYVKQRRRRRVAGELADGAFLPSSPSLSQLKELARDAVLKSLISEEMPAYSLPSLIRTLTEVELAATEEQRKAERHEAWRAKLHAAIEKKSEAGQKSMTMGEVVDLVDSVMRGEAA